ncbi:MAG: hypothetical protein AAFP13_15795 [Pseudomonadota bacterium]
MTDKSIEVYHDIAAIPGEEAPLEFRNAAMALIEAALEEAGAGEWEGAEIGAGEVNIGFEVEDFDVAEGIVRAAVAGTRLAGIARIERREMTEADYLAMVSASGG